MKIVQYIEEGKDFPRGFYDTPGVAAESIHRETYKRLGLREFDEDVIRITMYGKRYVFSFIGRSVVKSSSIEIDEGD